MLLSSKVKVFTNRVSYVGGGDVASGCSVLHDGDVVVVQQDLRRVVVDVFDPQPHQADVVALIVVCLSRLREVGCG